MTVTDQIFTVPTESTLGAISAWHQQWLALDDPAHAWHDEHVDSAVVSPWDVSSVLCALEDYGPVARAAFDDRRGRVPVTTSEISTGHGVTRSCPVPETQFVYQRDGHTAIAWCESFGGHSHLFCTATDTAYRDQVIDELFELATTTSSRWRGSIVELDPGSPDGLRHLAADEDLAPPEQLQTDLRRNLVLPLTRPDLREAVPRRGVLLHGRPGTGKSSALQWVARQVAGTATVIVATPSTVGNAPMMRRAFDMAADAAPCLLVLEDLDIGAGNRMFNPAALSELLNSMDGPGRNPGVFVAATTNAPEALDPAISQRPGRFDVTVEVPEAGDDARRHAIERLAERIGIDDPDEVDEVWRRTRGWSIAEVDALGPMAVLVAADTGEAPSLVAAAGGTPASGAAHRQRGIGYA